MWGGEPFIEVLVDKLGGLLAEPPVVPVHVPYAPVPFPFTLPFEPRFRFTANAYRAATASTDQSPRPRPFVPPFPPPPAAPPPPPPRGPARSFTPRQQQAFDVFVKRGVRLPTDFSDGELRRAFRELARQCHPDRHPGCTAAEQAHYSRLFAEVYEAYRHLLVTMPQDIRIPA